jgi:hypothetical protein
MRFTMEGVSWSSCRAHRSAAVYSRAFSVLPAPHAPHHTVRMHIHRRIDRGTWDQTHTHTHTLTNTERRKHTHTHTHTHTYTEVQAHTHTHTLSLTLTHTHTHTHIHTYMHTYRHSHSHSHTHKHKHKHTLTNTERRKHTHTHTHTHTHRDIHTHNPVARGEGQLAAYGLVSSRRWCSWSISPSTRPSRMSDTSRGSTSAAVMLSS